MTLAPVVLFTYNRIEHLKQTIAALQKNDLAEKSELYVFSDGPSTPKDVNSIEEIRRYLNSVKGFKNIQIHAQDSNMGLAKSIISGINSIFENYDNVIVLEDDLVTSASFLKYMNNCLSVYGANPNIFSISGY